MRLLAIATILATLPWAAAAAPTWQTISSEPGKRIELDRTSLKRDDSGKVQAQGRVILEKELIDAKSGAGYRVIEAITRYDCNSRNANTIKRIFKKNESEVIREEEIKGNDLPVRSGTLDDKVLREVCRPPKDNVTEVAQKANEAAEQLKLANEALLKKELAKPEKPSIVKASEPAHATPSEAPKSAIPSIRPNLKAQMDASREHVPVPAPAPAPVPAKEMPPPAKEALSPKSSTIIVHTTSKPAAHSTRPAKSGGYMLELAHGNSAEQHRHIHWSYDGEGGPENWAKLDPKNTACATGQRQSPIDIREGIKVDLEPVQFDYRPSSFRIIDNGHTVQVNVGDSSITLTGKTYELIQFHFHRPSEERLTVAISTWLPTWYTRQMTVRWQSLRYSWNAARKTLHPDTMEQHATGKERFHIAANAGHQPILAAACQPQLLHLHGFADDTTMHRRCTVAGHETTSPGIDGTNRHFFAALPQ